MDSEPAEAAEPSEPAEPTAAARKAFLVRLSPQLHDELRGWAAEELRSLNGHIEYLLRRAIEERRRTARRK